MSRNAIAGGILWTGMAAFSGLHWIHLNTIELLFLLAPLVIVPLGLELSSRFMQQKKEFPIRTAEALQLPAALCAIAALLLPPGRTAALLALPWFAVGCLTGLTGLLLLFGANSERSRRRAES